jgi:sialate O-acetylesterase
LIGDVWICSGQSNMEWIVRNTDDAMKEIKLSDYPMIRHIKIPHTLSGHPLDDVSGDWKICTPETSADFTAVGYFFAVELYKKLNIPIGLINTSWGGTNIETWISKKSFENSEEFKSMIASVAKLSLDSLIKVNELALLKKIESLQGKLEKSSTIIQSWKELSFDDSRWPHVNVPGVWEQQTLGNFDGVVWYRKSINLNEEFAGKEAVLELAMIDDSDETYVNGLKVGGMDNKHNEKRRYTIPKGILKNGKNLISVKVIDFGGAGGIVGDSSDVKISIPTVSVSLAGQWLFQVESKYSSFGVSPNDYPSLLFNAMINPLVQYPIKGAIWYQGESNAARAYQYRKAFPLLINDWRSHWKQGDFPFYFVQLASYEANDGNSTKGSSWAELREAQMLTLSLPNTGMVVTIDIGDTHDIHPRNKKEVGKRLAAIALHGSYKTDVVPGGPVYQSMKIEGNKVILSFSGIGSGLSAKDKYGYLKGFEIAGVDKKFHYAKAIIEGNNVMVFHGDVKNPVAVRFGWADDAKDCNLFNLEGFPAHPFRTDDWKGITEKEKYKTNQ